MSTQSSDRKVRWGVLGYARIARMQVIPAIARAGNAELCAIASRSLDKLAEAHNAHAIPHGYDDYNDFIADLDIDAIYVPLPNALHHEWAIRAMQAGKHVLCEKPLALNAHQAGEMIDAAKHNGCLLMEAFMYRYSARFAKLKEILASGVLGELRHINASFRFLLDRPNTIKTQSDLGGGALYDVGCYPVDLLGAITGNRPIDVTASGYFENGVDVNASALLRYENGLIAALHCGFNAYGRNYAEFIGSKGMLEINDMFGESAGEIKLSTADGVQIIPVAPCDRYAAQIRDFSDAIIHGRAPRLALQESLMNMQVLDQIHAALKN